jgi:hypothetical protein
LNRQVAKGAKKIRLYVFICENLCSSVAKKNQTQIAQMNTDFTNVYLETLAVNFK